MSARHGLRPWGRASLGPGNSASSSGDFSGKPQVREKADEGLVEEGRLQRQEVHRAAPQAAGSPPGARQLEGQEPYVDVPPVRTEVVRYLRSALAFGLGRFCFSCHHREEFLCVVRGYHIIPFHEQLLAAHQGAGPVIAQLLPLGAREPGLPLGGVVRPSMAVPAARRPRSGRGSGCGRP